MVLFKTLSEIRSLTKHGNLHEATAYFFPENMIIC